MSKSPIKDYSRLIDNVRTAKKDNEYTSSLVHGPSHYKESFSSDKIISELKMKLQLSLKHNTRLLDQNSMLSEMVNKIRFQLKGSQQQIVLLESSMNQQLVGTQRQRNDLLQEIQQKQKLHESELERLLNEISVLHKEKNAQEVLKNKQIENLKDNYQKSTLTYIQNMKNSQNNAKEIYERQISAFKEQLQRKEHENQNLKALHKIQSNKLNDKINQLSSEIKHQKNLSMIEIEEMKNKFQNDLQVQKRSIDREKELQASTYEATMKRLKNQILDKNGQIDALGRKLAHSQETSQVENIHLKKEKQQLLLQLANMQVAKMNTIIREKAKINQINKQQIENLVAMNQTHIDSLNSEANRLKQLIDYKTFQLRKLIEENSKLKQTLLLENDLIKKENEYLKKSIKGSQADKMEELELFKIKMTQLFHSDVEALSAFYQNEVANLTVSNNELSKIHESTKEKLYKSILENDELRKNFEIELSKQKSRVLDLKIKLAALSVQHKEYVSSIGTKMNLTSQTLIRQTDQKHKSVSFYQEEKRKFHSLLNTKDKQIADLLQSIHKIKQMHENQINVLRAQKNDLHIRIQDMENDNKRIKSTFLEEIARKDQKLKETVDHSSKDKEEVKALGLKNEEVQKENIKLQKQCQHLVRQNRSMAQQLGLKKGFIETLQMESCAAIEDEKAKVKLIMNSSQVSLKKYFQEKLQSKDKDIKTLKTLLEQKEEDVRDLIIKYNALEKRLSTLLETQTKLIDFQQKVKSIGMDNNLVKNLAQLFRRYQH